MLQKTGFEIVNHIGGYVIVKGLLLAEDGLHLHESRNFFAGAINRKVI